MSVRLRTLKHWNLSFKVLIQTILATYRITPHSITGQLPTALLYGLDPQLAPDVYWRMISACVYQNRLQFINDLRDCVIQHCRLLVQRTL